MPPQTSTASALTSSMNGVGSRFPPATRRPTGDGATDAEREVSIEDRVSGVTDDDVPARLTSARNRSRGGEAGPRKAKHGNAQRARPGSAGRPTRRHPGFSFPADPRAVAG